MARAACSAAAAGRSGCCRLSPQLRTSLLRTAAPVVSPGWAEQGSLCRVVDINSTTANTSLRYQPISSNQSLIAISLSQTKSPKGTRKGIKRPRASLCPLQMAREKPRIENNRLGPALCPSCRGTSQEFHARRATTKQSLQVCRGPRLTERLLVYLPPISIAWACSRVPGSPGCSPPARPVPAQAAKPKATRLAAEPQMGDAIAAGKRCQGCSVPCWAFFRSQLSSWGANQRGDVAAGGWI